MLEGVQLIVIEQRSGVDGQVQKFSAVYSQYRFDLEVKGRLYSGFRIALTYMEVRFG